jgi:hypothetical protein
MITANYYTLDSQQVGEKLTFCTNDLEFATLQAIAVTGMELIIQSDNFSLIGDGVKRMVISCDPL